MVDPGFGPHPVPGGPAPPRHRGSRLGLSLRHRPALRAADRRRGPGRRAGCVTLRRTRANRRCGRITMVGTIEFAGGDHGPWRVTRAQNPTGEGLPDAPRVSITLVGPEAATPPAAAWRLRGAVSNLRYATRGEAQGLRAVQPVLDRPEATRAALIPIRKSPRWWELAQDERRAIFEETSHHTAIGLGYLPAVARRLHHSRDLGEPFVFLTWFRVRPRARRRVRVPGRGLAREPRMDLRRARGRHPADPRRAGVNRCRRRASATRPPSRCRP